MFFLAEDGRDTLERAAATVLGPVSNAEDALSLLDQETPDCALVDVNLGAGPEFECALALKARNVPFVFLTGYDADVIPPEFAGAPRLEKPTESRRKLAAVAALCRGDAAQWTPDRWHVCARPEARRAGHECDSTRRHLRTPAY